MTSSLAFVTQMIEPAISEAYWFLFLPVFERMRNMAKRY